MSVEELLVGLALQVAAQQQRVHAHQPLAEFAVDGIDRWLRPTNGYADPGAGRAQPLHEEGQRGLVALGGDAGLELGGVVGRVEHFHDERVGFVVVAVHTEGLLVEATGALHHGVIEAGLLACGRGPEHDRDQVVVDGHVLGAFDGFQALARIVDAGTVELVP